MINISLFFTSQLYRLRSSTFNNLFRAKGVYSHENTIEIRDCRRRVGRAPGNASIIKQEMTKRAKKRGVALFNQR